MLYSKVENIKFNGTLEFVLKINYLIFVHDYKIVQKYITHHYITGDKIRCGFIM